MNIRDANTQEAARVNTEGQLSTLSEIQTEARHVAEDGSVFMIATGFAVSSTTGDQFTNIVYILNDSTTKDVHVGYMRTCNEVPGKWRLLYNPTALGTSEITARNMKIGTATPLNGTVQQYSAAGTSFSDGTVLGQWIQSGPAHSIQGYEGSLILPPLQSIALEFAPFGTTAGDVCATIQLWQVGS